VVLRDRPFRRSLLLWVLVGLRDFAQIGFLLGTAWAQSKNPVVSGDRKKYMLSD